MSASDFFSHTSNLPFFIAAVILGTLLMLEIAALFIGAALSHWHVDADTPDVDGPLDWINPGHVPAMVLIAVFCGAFASLGYVGQWIYLGVSGQLASWLLASPVALALSLPIVRVVSGILARIMPHDESSAISIESLTGDVGTLTLGPIGQQPDDCGMAIFVDKFGTSHTVMVTSPGGPINPGEPVTLLGPHPTRDIAYIVRKA